MIIESCWSCISLHLTFYLSFRTIHRMNFQTSIIPFWIKAKIFISIKTVLKKIQSDCYYLKLDIPLAALRYFPRLSSISILRYIISLHIVFMTILDHETSRMQRNITVVCVLRCSIDIQFLLPIIKSYLLEQYSQMGMTCIDHTNIQLGFTSSLLEYKIYDYLWQCESNYHYQALSTQYGCTCLSNYRKQSISSIFLLLFSFFRFSHPNPITVPLNIFFSKSLLIFCSYIHTKRAYFENFIYSFARYCCTDLPFSNKIDYF